MKYIDASICACVQTTRRRANPSLEEFQECDSGWALSRILNLTINVNKLNPLRAGCHIEMPWEIATKRAMINVRTMDNGCFA